MGRVCFTQFGTRMYANKNFTASDLFPMFTKSINFWIFYCNILKSTNV